MHSLQAFWDAVQTFFERLGAVSFGALALALAFHLANLVLRTRGWRNILGAAFPDTKVRWPPVFGSYVAGVGVNSVVPARGGDAVKLFLLHGRIDGATYPTLTSSLLAETLFDIPMGVSLLLWAWTLGVVPSLPSLPGLGAFEFSWLADHPQATLTGLIIFFGLGAAALIVYSHRVRAFWQRVRRGLAILATPKRYLKTVVSYQAAGWICRVVSAYFFLQAFHVTASVRNALIVLVVQGVATSLPLTPGGLGPKQALLVVLLAGQSASSTIVAFSVGMELAILLFNVALAVCAMGIMLHGFHFRRAIAEARAKRAEAEGAG